MATTATAGELRDSALPQLLLALYAQRATGTLSLEHGRTTKQVQLVAGAPLSVDSNLPSERLSVQLERNGDLSREQAERVRTLAAERGCREAAAVAALEWVDSQTLFQALRDSARISLLSCFGWREGRFAWAPEPEAQHPAQTLRSDPYPLVQRGIAAHWPTERILRDLYPRQDLCTAPSATFPEILARLDRDAVLDLVLAGLAGRTLMGDLLARAMRSPSALAGVWLLDAAGGLEYEAPLADDTQVSQEATAVEMEIAIIEASVDPKSEAAARTRPHAAPVGNAAANPEAVALRQEILERHARERDPDHYAALGVPADAAMGVIKKTYRSAAKRFHPDRLARLGLDDIKAEAAEVFARIAEAHAVLSDAQRRRDYDASLLDSSEGIDLNRVAQAEGFFRKGEVLMKMGDFRAASELLQNAVDVWPDECVYQSALGWSLFKQVPPDAGSARAHLDYATGLDPDNAQAHYWLGLVLRSLGETRAASESLARARALDPSIG